MAELTLVRHPRTGAAPGLCYGRHEPPPGPHGTAAANALITRLSPPTIVVTSPAPRCHTLAQILVRRFACRLSVDADWRELDFGSWEGRLWRDIDRSQSDPWAEDPLNRAPPGGETYRAMLARVNTALARTPARAVVITHAGAIRAALMLSRGWSFEQAFATPIAFAQPVEVRR